MTQNSNTGHPARSAQSKNSPVDSLIGSARSGSTKALGDLLQTSREYLLLVANHELPTGLRAKVGASDLVQETFLVAQRQFHRFEGRTEAELLLWLKAILRNTAAHLRRSFRSNCRDATRKVRWMLTVVWLKDFGPRFVSQRHRFASRTGHNPEIRHGATPPTRSPGDLVEAAR